MNLEDLYQKMEYGPAPENSEQAEQWLEEHQRQFTFFINGKWVKSSNESRFENMVSDFFKK